MINIKKNIVIQAVQIKNEIYPIWDKRITYHKGDEMGEYLKFEGEYEKIFNMVDAIYNLLTKKITLGIEIDVYPSKSNFELNEVVLIEKNNGSYYISEIVGIEYNRFKVEAMKGSKLIEYYGKNISDTEIDTQLFYKVKVWEHDYLLKDGEVIEWSYQIKKLVDK